MLKKRNSAESSNIALGTVLQFFKAVSPGDAKNVPTIIRKLYPHVASSSSAELQAFMNNLPTSDVIAKLSADRSGWSGPVLAELLTRLPDDKSHRKTYPATVRRLVEFAEKSGLLAPAACELLPEWGEFLACAETLLPGDKAALSRLAEAGLTKFLDRYDIDLQNLEATAVKIRSMRYALKRLAKEASKEGLTPRDFAEEVMAAPDPTVLKKLATDTIYASYCRSLWNCVIENYPQFDFPLWEDRRRFVSIPESAWPASIRAGLKAAIFERPDAEPIAPTTAKSYRTSLGSMLGLLQSAGLDLDPIVADLVPQDALRLAFCGWPRALLTENEAQDSAKAIHDRLQADSEYRAEVLVQIRAQDGHAAGSHLVANPFVDFVVKARLAEEKYASAHALLARVNTINADYFAMGEGNRKWLSARFKRIASREASQDTAYDARKQIVFKHPRLFEVLMAQQSILFSGLDERFKSRGSQWATQVRDLCYLALVTLYPLRVTNHQLMKVEINYKADSHIIEIEGKQVKNGKAIDFQLPSKGGFAWVRDLVDLYLGEARPILLCGAESPYFFVGNRTIPNAKGFLARQQFNQILLNLSQSHIKDCIPPDLGHLGPHLFRHIAATYQIVVCKNEDLAAKLLNDTPETIRKHYADILADSRGSCKSFYDGVQA